MRTEVEQLIGQYRGALFSAAFAICRNPQDAEDVVWETFEAYDSRKKEYESEEHIKAWLLRVAINRAKNIRTSFWNRNRVPYEEYMKTLPFVESADERLLEAVLGLPEKYRIVVHLFYYEEYRIKEIARLLSLPENTVKVRLSRARGLLKRTLKEEWNDDES